jgi:hypothetical protein
MGRVCKDKRPVAVANSSDNKGSNNHHHYNTDAALIIYLMQYLRSLASNRKISLATESRVARPAARPAGRLVAGRADPGRSSLLARRRRQGGQFLDGSSSARPTGRHRSAGQSRVARANSVAAAAAKGTRETRAAASA